MSFDLLPEEVLTNIFFNLSIRQRIRIERVCVKWNKLSMDGVKYVKFRAVWNVQRLMEENDRYTRESKDRRLVFVSSWGQANKVIQKCKRLTSVKFDCCDFHDMDAFSETCGLISACRKVSFLRGTSSIEILNTMNQHLSQIEEFTLWKFDIHNYSTAAFNCFLRRNRKLNVLRINAGLLSLDFRLTAKLSELRLEALYVFPSALLTSLSESSGELLQKLDLARGDQFNVSDESCRIISRFPHLKELRIRVSFNHLPALQCEKLESLRIDLMEYGDVDERCRYHLFSFLKRNTRLTSLNLSGYGGLRDKFIDDLSVCCPEVRYLFLGFGEIVDSKNLQSLVKFAKLENIGLSHVMASAFEMAAVVRDAQSLRVLDFFSGRKHGPELGIEVWKAFIQKARLNPSQRYYLNTDGFDDFPEIEKPRNLFWRGDCKPKDHRSLSCSDWYRLVDKPRLQD